ncbi:hypothetical protein D3C80_1745890 [compost metagenome]
MTFTAPRRQQHFHCEPHQQHRTAQPQHPAHGLELQQHGHAGQGRHRIQQITDTRPQAQPEALKKPALHGQGDHGDIGDADIQAQGETEEKSVGKRHRAFHRQR